MNKKLTSLKQIELLIVNFASNTKKTAKGKQTKGFLDVRSTLLRQYWSKYVSLHEECKQDPESEIEQFTDEEKIMSYDEVERVYSETLGELQDLITPVTKVSSENASEQRSHSADMQQSSKHLVSASSPALPRLKIPQFDGSFTNWYPFKDLFTSIVIKNGIISNTERLQYLKDNLIGDAKNALDNITTTDDNFTIAWELLENKYDNKRIIINAHLTEFVKWPLVKKESAAELRALLDKATSTIRALKQMDRPVEHWDDWLVYTIVHKLDNATVRAWEFSISSSSSLPTFEILSKFLGNYIKSLEIVQNFGENRNATTSKDTASTKPRTHGVKGFHTTTEHCPCYSNKHYILFCTAFRNLTAQQRRNTAMKANLCLNCLRPGHKSKDCTSTRRC